MGLEGFEIFSEDGDGSEGDMDAIMQMINHSIEEHGMDPRDGVKIIFDLLWPGHTDTSHDVKPVWSGAMYTLGFGEVCQNFGAIYVNEMPWGVGFSISVLPEFDFYALSKGAQQAVVRALGVTLEAGGLIVEHLPETNQLKITRPKSDDDDDGDSMTMDVDAIVGRFTKEMETELPKLLGDDNPGGPRKWFP